MSAGTPTRENRSLVLSQPMFLPWRGMFEQIKLSDVFVFYDDVQLPLGGGRGRGFITRVQIKPPDRSSQWLSIPICRSGKGTQLIKDSVMADTDWRAQHLRAIARAYSTAPFYREIEETVIQQVYSLNTRFLGEFCMHSMRVIGNYLGLDTPAWQVSSNLSVSHAEDASQRVLDYCLFFKANRYISGLGAKNYINYDIFEKQGVRIHYMDYRLTPYPQLHGDFNPYVSIIDLLFNVGKEAPRYLESPSVYWKQVVPEKAAESEYDIVRE